MNREDAVEALAAKGYTVEQATAFLDLLGSGFRRRGWVDGDPLTDDEIAQRWAVLSKPPSGGAA